MKTLTLLLLSFLFAPAAAIVAYAARRECWRTVCLGCAIAAAAAGGIRYLTGG